MSDAIRPWLKRVVVDKETPPATCCVQVIRITQFCAEKEDCISVVVSDSVHFVKAVFSPQSLQLFRQEFGTIGSLRGSCIEIKEFAPQLNASGTNLVFFVEQFSVLNFQTNDVFGDPEPLTSVPGMGRYLELLKMQRLSHLEEFPPSQCHPLQKCQKLPSPPLFNPSQVPIEPIKERFHSPTFKSPQSHPLSVPINQNFNGPAVLELSPSVFHRVNDGDESETNLPFAAFSPECIPTPSSAVPSTPQISDEGSVDLELEHSLSSQPTTRSHEYEKTFFTPSRKKRKSPVSRSQETPWKAEQTVRKEPSEAEIEALWQQPIDPTGVPFLRQIFDSLFRQNTENEEYR